MKNFSRCKGPKSAILIPWFHSISNVFAVILYSKWRHQGGGRGYAKKKDVIYMQPLREGFKKKKRSNLGFWLKLGRAGVWGGVEGPTLLSGILFIALNWFKCFKTWNKAMKKCKWYNTPSPSHPNHSYISIKINTESENIICIFLDI